MIGFRSTSPAALSALAILLLTGCEGMGALKVLENPPAVSILEPSDGAVFEQDETVRFLGLVDSDFTGGDLVVSWNSDADGDFEDSDPPDPDGYVELVTRQLSAGPHVITLRAVDANAEQGEDFIEIEVLGEPEEEPDPEEPSIEVIHPASGEQGLQDTPFVFGALVSDFQDDPTDLYVEVSEISSGLVCEMTVDSSGNAQCDGAFPVGDYTLTFLVRDSDDNTTAVSASFPVVDPDDYDFDGDGVSVNGGDCNDDNNTVYPGAPEICDGLDNDCIPATGIDVGSECYDDDGDGYCELPPCVNAVASIPDCDDTNASVSPDGTEAPNYLDDDCNGLVDDTTVRWDDDSDGYCEAPPCENVGTTQSDCDDTNALVHPAATEICDDGLDNNCNGAYTEQNASGCTSHYTDSDGDGYGTGVSQCWCSGGSYPYTATNSTDCYDSNASVHPGQTNYFTYHRGDGTFDYNCNGADEQQYTATSSGCDWDIVYLSCDQNGSDGWDGGTPSCGSSGQWNDDCDGSYDAVCMAFCLLSSDVVSCLLSCSATCDPEYTSITQSCR